MRRYDRLIGTLRDAPPFIAHDLYRPARPTERAIEGKVFCAAGYLLHLAPKYSATVFQPSPQRVTLAIHYGLSTQDVDVLVSVNNAAAPLVFYRDGRMDMGYAFSSSRSSTYAHAPDERRNVAVLRQLAAWAQQDGIDLTVAERGP